jgi:DNA-binding NarL/FixJ family response regulator
VTIRVLLVDDQALMRSGLRLIIEAASDMDVVGEAGDGAEALTIASRARPDVVLLDIRMPGMGGIETTRALTREPDGPRILILTTYDLDEHLWDAINAGASGFMLKTAPPSQLLEAVRTVAGGEAVVAPNITRRLLEQFARRPPAHQQPALFAGLTTREQEVFRLVGRGLNNDEIAAQLYLSVATVKSHLNSLFRKLNVRDRVHAVVLAHESGIVRPDN